MLEKIAKKRGILYRGFSEFWIRLQGVFVYRGLMSIGSTGGFNVDRVYRGA